MNTGLRNTLFAALLALPATASAEWVEIERFDDGMRVYVDPRSIRRSGDIARLEHLVRWGEPQIEPGQPAYLSTVVRTDYDCTAKLERYQSSASYAGAMGNGPRVTVDLQEAETWATISASSMEEKLWSTACGATLQMQIPHNADQQSQTR